MLRQQRRAYADAQFDTPADRPLATLHVHQVERLVQLALAIEALELQVHGAERLLGLEQKATSLEHLDADRLALDGARERNTGALNGHSLREVVLGINARRALALRRERLLGAQSQLDARTRLQRVRILEVVRQTQVDRAYHCDLEITVAQVHITSIQDTQLQ